MLVQERDHQHWSNYVDIKLRQEYDVRSYLLRMGCQQHAHFFLFDRSAHSLDAKCN